MAEPKEVKTVSNKTVSAENSSFRSESVLMGLIFLHDAPARRKRVSMNKICRIFMVRNEKAKINYYSIRAEMEFIVFLQKNHSL